MRTLLLHRRGVLFEDPWLGPTFELPAEPTVASLGLTADHPEALDALVANDNALPERLGLDRDLAQFGRVTAIRAWALHDPTPWERRVVAWIATHLDITDPLLADEPPAGPFAALGNTLADPIAPWPATPPAGLALLEGDDPDLEALGATRRLRQQLVAEEPTTWPAWTNGVLILVPDDATRLAIWRARLEEAGLPVRSRGWQSLTETPVGRWALALAALAGGDTRAVRRVDLEAVFGAPLFTMPDGGRSADLRAILRELRRPSVTFGLLKHHAAAWFTRRLDALPTRVELTDVERTTESADLTARAAAVETLLTWLSEALGSDDAPGVWSRLLVLLNKEHLAVHGRVGAAKRPELLAMLTGVTEALDELARAGASDEVAPAMTLREALSSRGRGLRNRPKAGVRLQTWSSWDGRGAHHVVLAGLEEGGFPRPPASKTALGRQLAERLALGSAPDELARQARVLARALGSSTDACLLTWATTDAEGSETFPGAFLAGRPTDRNKDPVAAEAWEHETTHVAERDLASQPAGAWSPADLRTLPKPPVIVDAAWADAERSADHAQTVERARAPIKPGSPIGPWTGLLGAPVPERAWSPTALEDLGQCATKFFLGRLLRAERDDDLGSTLDPMESGSLVHASFAAAALDGIAKDGAWRLQPAAGQDPLAFGNQRADEAARSTNEQVTALTQEHPTLGLGIATWTARRWEKAMRAALVEEAQKPRGGALGVTLPEVADLQEAELDIIATLNKDAMGAVEKYRKTRDEVGPATTLIDTLVNEGLTVKTAAAARANDLGLKDLSVLSAAAINKATSKAGVDGAALHQIVADKLAAAIGKLEPHVEAAFEADRQAVPRDVVAAEWSFGMPVGQGPIDQRSVAEPLQIDVEDGAPLALKGRVDRIDGDPTTCRLAIADYKSGTKKSAGKLLTQFGTGRHLQLPIYGRAATQLLAPKALGWGNGSTTEIGRLQFTRSSHEAALDLGGLQPVTGTDNSPQDADQVLKTHLSHSARRLRRGLLPLAPRACPLSGGADAYCAFERSCGFSPTAEPLADTDPQPLFAEAKEEADPKPKKLDELRPLAALAPATEPPSAELAKRTHAEAEAVVTDLDRDVVVSAGAGSGKTTQLVNRYVEAIKAGHSPDAILAITFTRKATAEMRTRVRARLLDRTADLSPEKLRAALLALGSAPVLTIDAFAARVVQALDASGSSELRVSANSQRFTEAWLESKLVTACDAPDPDLRQLLEQLPLSEVRAQLHALLASGAGRISAGAHEAPAALVDRWTTALEHAWPELQRDLLAFDALATAILADGSSVPEGLERTVDPLRSAVTAAGRMIDDLGALGLLASLPHVPTTGIKKAEDLPELQAAWQAVATLKSRWCSGDAPTVGLSKRLGHLVKVATASGADPVVALRKALTDEAALTLAALRVAAAWREELDAERCDRSVLGFDDVLARATALLQKAAATEQGAAEVQAQLGFAHVFVDEFQDTNRAQVKLVEALRAALEKAGKAPHLFLVGDVKQSIYRFRGAEVDVFEAETRREGRTKVTLDACWRARPPLTRSIDRLFERVLAPTHAAGGPTDRLAAVPWEPLAPRWHDAGQGDGDEDVGPCVELLGSPTFEHKTEVALDDETNDADADEDAEGEVVEDTVSNDATEVNLVIARVQQLRREHPDWTIALLTHSWALAARWGGHLRAAHIPAFVQGGRGLLTDPAVAPILAILEALEREDDLGLLEVLRGPLVGLSDSGLWAIRNGAGVTLPTFGSGPARPTPPMVRLRSLRHGFVFDPTAAQAWLDTQRDTTVPAATVEALQSDAERVAAWSGWWPQARNSFGLDPIDRTVALIVAAAGFRRTLYGDGGDEARLQLAALRRFEKLLRSLASSPEGGSADVVRELRRMADDEGDPAAAINPYSGDAVTVTVVHQAKGLAWDVVVLPALGAARVKTRVDSLAPVRVLDADNAPVDLPLTRRATARDLFALERGLAAELVHLASEPWERAEQRRLLYVACTRARERLVLSGGLPTCFSEARKALAKLSKRAPADAPSHRVAKSWLEDVLIALDLQVDETLAEDGKSVVSGAWGLGDGAWVAGRDYAWVQPVAAPVERAAVALGTWPVDTARRLAIVPDDALVVRNPSKEKPGSIPLRLPEDAPIGSDPKLLQPFGSARLAGTIAHRAFATWAWRDLPIDAFAAAAVRDELPASVVDSPSFAGHLPGYAAWVVEILRTAEARQPVLARALREAATRGDLVHEARVQVDLGGERIEGSIDLLWRDASGLWHLLDYKTTETAEISDTSIDGRVLHYHPQVALYAATVQGRLPAGERLATYGLWFVREGRVVRWAAP